VSDRVQQLADSRDVIGAHGATPAVDTEPARDGPTRARCPYLVPYGLTPCRPAQARCTRPVGRDTACETAEVAIRPRQPLDAELTQMMVHVQVRPA
jgi:hypothetical protein